MKVLFTGIIMYYRKVLFETHSSLSPEVLHTHKFANLTKITRKVKNYFLCFFSFQYNEIKEICFPRFNVNMTLEGRMIDIEDK